MELIFTKPPVSEEKVRQFELKIGAPLPDDYRRFLLKHNGGRPKTEIFDFPDGKDSSGVNMFYPLDPKDTNALEAKLEVFQERIPKEFIAFGGDPFGNQLVIGTAGEERGKIYFWDREMEADEGEEPDMSNMDFLANSFEDFLAMLYEYDGE